MSRFRTIILFTITLFFAILAIITEKIYFSDYEYHLRTRRFNKILAEKETIMETRLNGISDESHQDSDTEKNIFKIAEKNKITILEYFDDRLIYWSDNDFDVPESFIDTLFNKPLVFFQNGWFLSKTVMLDNKLIAGLLRIRTEYGFANDIIRNGF